MRYAFVFALMLATNPIDNFMQPGWPSTRSINEMERILDLGADAIFTDRPDRLLEVLRNRENAR